VDKVRLRQQTVRAVTIVFQTSGSKLHKVQKHINKSITPKAD